MKTDNRNLANIVTKLRGPRIAVVGDFMLDRYVWGSAARLSPEAPVPVVDFSNETQVLGGAGNVAANLAALGAAVLPFGVTGEDEPGRAIRECLAAAGITSKGLLADARRMTTVKTRIIARQQQIVRVDRERRAPLSQPLEETLIRRIKAALNNLDALVISDYDKGVVTDALAERVLAECHRRGVPALVKPKTSRLFAYRGATAIVCNTKEAGFFVTRQLDDDESIGQAGRALLAHFGCAAVVITRGADGLSVFEDSAPTGFHVQATSREVSYARVGQTGVDHAAHGRQVFDVTGAGDTVLSVLALAIAARAPLRDSAVLANAGAGVVVEKLGTSTITPDELLAAVRDLR
jgi:D-beta-D-heptose 7-phosphate kinase/D-beta-D-heptose 1-phosphate adenosyltransferase